MTLRPADDVDVDLVEPVEVLLGPRRIPDRDRGGGDRHAQHVVGWAEGVVRLGADEQLKARIEAAAPHERSTSRGERLHHADRIRAFREVRDCRLGMPERVVDPTAPERRRAEGDVHHPLRPAVALFACVEERLTSELVGLAEAAIVDADIGEQTGRPSLAGEIAGPFECFRGGEQPFLGVDHATLGEGNPREVLARPRHPDLVAGRLVGRERLADRRLGSLVLALENVGHPATTKRIGDQARVAVGAGEFERRARPSEGFVMIVGPLGELGCNQLAAEPRAERTLVAQQGCRLIEIGTGADCGEIRSSTGLGITLAPELSTRPNPGQVFFFLRLGTKGQECGSR